MVVGSIESLSKLHNSLDSSSPIALHASAEMDDKRGFFKFCLYFLVVICINFITHIYTENKIAFLIKISIFLSLGKHWLGDWTLLLKFSFEA